MDEQMTRGLVALIAHTLPQLTKLLPADDQWRNGGWICIVDTREDPSGRMILHQQVGQVSDEKVAKYRTFSLEKAQRLINRPDDRTSFQSRNEAAQQYGGAIRFKDYIISFSGLPELWDEALVLFIAWVYHLADGIPLGELRAEVKDCCEALLKLH